MSRQKRLVNSFSFRVSPVFPFNSKARSFRVTAANIQGAPEMVVKILSEGKRKTDGGIKKKMGVRVSSCNMIANSLVD